MKALFTAWSALLVCGVCVYVACNDGADAPAFSCSSKPRPPRAPPSAVGTNSSAAGSSSSSDDGAGSEGESAGAAATGGCHVLLNGVRSEAANCNAAADDGLGGGGAGAAAPSAGLASALNADAVSCPSPPTISALAPCWLSNMPKLGGPAWPLWLLLGAAYACCACCRGCAPFAAGDDGGDGGRENEEHGGDDPSHSSYFGPADAGGAALPPALSGGGGGAAWGAPFPPFPHVWEPVRAALIDACAVWLALIMPIRHLKRTARDLLGGGVELPDASGHIFAVGLGLLPFWALHGALFAGNATGPASVARPLSSSSSSLSPLPPRSPPPAVSGGYSRGACFAASLSLLAQAPWVYMTTITAAFFHTPLEVLLGWLPVALLAYRAHARSGSRGREEGGGVAVGATLSSFVPLSSLHPPAPPAAPASAAAAGGKARHGARPSSLSAKDMGGAASGRGVGECKGADSDEGGESTVVSRASAASGVAGAEGGADTAFAAAFAANQRPPPRSSTPSNRCCCCCGGALHGYAAACRALAIPLAMWTCALLTVLASRRWRASNTLILSVAFDGAMLLLGAILMNCTACRQKCQQRRRGEDGGAVVEAARNVQGGGSMGALGR